jgi:squalene monooxygenase
MTVALHDAVLLTAHLSPSESLSDLSDWETIRRRLQEWHWQRKHLAGVVNVLSIALYDLFGADGEFKGFVFSLVII